MCARARIPRARPGLDSEYLFDEPDLSLPLIPPVPLSPWMYVYRSNIASYMGTHVHGHVYLGIILSKISKDARMRPILSQFGMRRNAVL